MAWMVEVDGLAQRPSSARRRAPDRILTRGCPHARGRGARPTGAASFRDDDALSCPGPPIRAPCGSAPARPHGVVAVGRSLAAGRPLEGRAERQPSATPEIVDDADALYSRRQGHMTRSAQSRPALANLGWTARGRQRAESRASAHLRRLPDLQLGRAAQRQPARTAPAKVTIPARGRRPGGTRRRVSRVAHCQITPSARGRLFYNS